jgi:hypothetical protein
MSRTRQLIYAFWIFVVMMLFWQFYTYDRHAQQVSIEHPQQEQHFFFLHTNAPTGGPVVHNDAYVRQISFAARANTPSQGMLTCSVVLRNDGKAKATNVQVMVRPYRGIRLGDDDAGHAKPGYLNDSDPISQLGQWVTFPDLAPGESSTQTAVFVSQQGLTPGDNPGPNIEYQTAKASDSASASAH